MNFDCFTCRWMMPNVRPSNGTVCKGGYSPAKMQVRNMWMVEYSDAVLALWDGTTGGTGNCVEYARRVNKRLIPCWDEWVAYSTKT